MVSFIDIPTPDSPRSDLSHSPPSLDPNTLALLDEFLSNKAEEEQMFQQLKAEGDLAHTSDGSFIRATVEKPMMSVDEYRRAFGEDWQLSQFWYSTSFANRLANLINKLEPCPRASIGFISSPTAFVAFQHLYPRTNTRLLEVDERFAILAPSQYIPYDLNEPDKFPKELRESFDVVVLDPPFLNEATNVKVIRTLRQVLKPSAKVILLTSTSIEDVIKALYDFPPLGPMRRTALKVEHGQLANVYGCWGSWEGAESFGKD
ncbi:hypothetical protein AGABI2DRAFT_198504 [Agaricus bisporus var. bisporus H97]|uniref:hypothetical protein n=1 Tax=Agaricus bisporus var. bisporus (strain H97 / ATCC MYA-4626 / FGSC 10389) TaxID=936046 RepID=UPI00029F5A38|nr:hypothetical protein AGABI2DRAFT_198504 [Agaricus bisporus var. bisporus H97]EKV51876.1 hypothetical protein AGABI2DRAFT_198504 [Agaricus bisporus var. bisporus H97]